MAEKNNKEKDIQEQWDIEKAGYEKGLGAWRAGGNGRFEIKSIK
jgi:hypothetical protein